jgi:hypothetical protein
MVVQRFIRLASILFSALFLPLTGGVCVAGEDEEPKATAATRGFTFRPHSLPYSRSFAVFDLGLSYRLNEGKGYYSTDSRFGLSLDLGYMRNLSPENAVGVSVFGMTDDRSERGGVRARYRRWLTPSLGADATAGMTLANSLDYNEVPGFVGSVGVQAGGLVGATLEAEQIRSSGGAGSVWDWRLGGRLGSGAGVVGTVLLIGALAAFIATYSYD